MVIKKSRREDLPLGEIWVGKFRLSQSHGVTEVLYESALAGERGTHTQTICMVTIEKNNNKKKNPLVTVRLAARSP